MIGELARQRDEGALRALVPGVLASLVRRGEDFDAAEDALQEALLEALRVWPEHPPRDTHAWLTTVATRRLVDARRSEAARHRRDDTYAQPRPAATEQGDDDTLFLHFCCAHPDLAPASQVALTLRAVGGLTTWEIAEGVRVLQSALAMQTGERRPGRYQVEAAIAALHDDAPSAGQTDWPQILAWYDDLVALTEDPARQDPAAVLGRAVAVGHVLGAAAGLRETDRLREVIGQRPGGTPSAGTCTSSGAICPPPPPRTPRPSAGPPTSASPTTWSDRPLAREPLAPVPPADRLAKRDVRRGRSPQLSRVHNTRHRVIQESP